MQEHYYFKTLECESWKHCKGRNNSDIWVWYCPDPERDRDSVYTIEQDKTCVHVLKHIVLASNLNSVPEAFAYLCRHYDQVKGIGA